MTQLRTALFAAGLTLAAGTAFAQDAVTKGLTGDRALTADCSKTTSQGNSGSKKATMATGNPQDATADCVSPKMTDKSKTMKKAGPSAMQQQTTSDIKKH